MSDHSPSTRSTRTLAAIVSATVAGILAVAAAPAASATVFAEPFDGCGRNDAFTFGTWRGYTLDFALSVGGKVVATGSQSEPEVGIKKLAVTWKDDAWAKANAEAASPDSTLGGYNQPIRIPASAYPADGSPLTVVASEGSGDGHPDVMTFTQTGATGACTIPHESHAPLTVPDLVATSASGKPEFRTLAVPRIERVTWKYAVVPAGGTAPTDPSTAKALPAAWRTTSWQTWHDIDLGGATNAKVVLFEIPDAGVKLADGQIGRHEFDLGGRLVKPLDRGLTLKQLIVSTDQGARVRIPTPERQGTRPYTPVTDAYTWYYRFERRGSLVSTPTPGLSGQLAGYTKLPAFQASQYDLPFDHVDSVRLIAVPNPAVPWSSTPATLVIGPGGVALDVPGDVDLDGVPEEAMIRKDGRLATTALTWSGTEEPGLRRGDFSAIDWIGSPGDLNGDHLSDRLMRDTDGRMWAYFAGMWGEFPRRTQVGTGWMVMDPAKLFVARGFTDGADSVLAVRPDDCRLYRYDMTEGGVFTGVVPIGTGWCGMTQVFSAGDQTGDGHPDVVGIKPNGDYMVYPGDGHGGWAGPPVRKGSDWHFEKVTAPAAPTPTVLALTKDGTLVRYTSDTAGRWNRPELVTRGWKETYRVLE